MSKIDKLINSIKNNPTNVKFEDLEKILISYGFEVRQPRGGSSHHTFKKDKYIITIPRHKPVNKIYVKQFIKIIDEISDSLGGKL
jgi:predicted RNA binding protein YcfA (HicA-like mRNA interferase family)